MSVPAQKDDLSAVAAAEFVDTVRQATRASLTYLVKRAHASKLGLIEYLILSRACDEDGVTARDATRAFDLSTSTMTGISDRLEKDKLVRRHAHPTDRRVLVLRATRRGQAVITRTAGPLLADLGELATALEPEQRAVLMTIFQQIYDTILEDL